MKEIVLNMPEFIINLARRSLSFLRWDPWQQISWSQEGEDLILARIMDCKRTGFYVDVGAHHPKRFSNTYYFYRRGWRGINIDAMPGSMRKFNATRPRDINIEIGIGEIHSIKEYNFFNDPAFNGFDSELSTSRDNTKGTMKIIGKVLLEILPLSRVLDEHLPEGQKIDFMSVDAEGLDLEVLRSNNWAKYKPDYVLAEILDKGLFELNTSSTAVFMKSVGYQVYSKSIHTTIFKRIDFS